MASARRLALLAILLLAGAERTVGQEPPPPPPSDPEPAAEEPDEEEDLLPSVDFYFPEGEMDFRLNGLIKNAFYEGQVRYDFVDGDITAFLRYRYYGYSRTYLLGVFDEVAFESVESGDNDFERVRGGLFLLEWPHSFHHRTFLLTEVDRITSNKEEFRFSTNRTNTFVRLGYQIGTPDDERSNAIVGETRAALQRLFSAYRDVGPGGFGLTGAVTYSDPNLGDFDYVKAEFEALKRVDFPHRNFTIGRLHGGSFLQKTLVRPDLEPVERYTIPRSEFFRLDGRDNLKGLSERLRGTEELHAIGEYFFPWFLGDDRRFLGLRWQDWYWVVYGGYGTVGFDRDVYTDTSSYFPDVGIGFEAGFKLKRYTFFVGGIVAQTLRGEGDLETRFSIKSHH